jgi:hypothetical protein
VRICCYIERYPICDVKIGCLAFGVHVLTLTGMVFVAFMWQRSAAFSFLVFDIDFNALIRMRLI